MAIVRELTTVLDFKEDMAGLNRYEAGVNRIKEITKGILSAVGLTLALDKIIEFADELVKTGKEVNRLSAQLKVLARPFDDMDEAQQQVFEGAQRMGLEYKEVLETFKGMYTELRGTTTPLGEIEDATENIYKALRVGRASAEEMHQTFQMLERGFRRGGIRSMGIGALAQLAPRAFDILGEQLVGGDRSRWEHGLREMAKEGKLTAEVVIGAFSRGSKTLQDDFEKVPQKLGWVFTRIYNDLVKVTAQIYKMTDASVALGRVVWFVYSRFRDVVVRVTDAMGGLKNIIEIVGIAIATYLVRNLLLLNLRTWAVVFANLALIATYAAMALAVVAVAVAIQDLFYWFMGKPSLLATWIGPFKDLKKNFAELDIFAGPRALKELFTGDFTGAWRDLKKVFTEVDAGMLALIGTAAFVKLAFTAWNILKFTGLIGAIGEVGGVVTALTTTIQTLNTTSLVTLAGQFGGILLLTQQLFALWQSSKDMAGDPSKWSKDSPFWRGIPQEERNKWPNAPKEGDTDPGRSWLWDTLKGFVTGGGTPTVAPGAIGSGGGGSPIITPQGNVTLNNTNNVTVQAGEAELAAQIQNTIQRMNNDMVDRVSREVSSATPRIESPIR